MQAHELQRPRHILLVEDNPADIRLTREAFQEAQIENYLHVVEDGVAALAYLHRMSPYENAPVPDLVLLDLNLPRLDGPGVLAVIKKDRRLRRIPVVVLSTSRAEDDILQSYDLHANCFITKPVNLDKFIDVLKNLEQFWFNEYRLPAD